MSAARESTKSQRQVPQFLLPCARVSNRASTHEKDRTHAFSSSSFALAPWFVLSKRPGAQMAQFALL